MALIRTHQDALTRRKPFYYLATPLVLTEPNHALKNPPTLKTSKGGTGKTHGSGFKASLNYRPWNNSPLGLGPSDRLHQYLNIVRPSLVFV